MFLNRLALGFIFFVLLGCSKSEQIHEINKEEKEALNHLIVNIYKDVFKLGPERPGNFVGVVYKSLPSNSQKELESPIETVALRSPVFLGEYEEIVDKIEYGVRDSAVIIGNDMKLKIKNYELDQTSLGRFGGSKEVVIIPLSVELSRYK